MSFKPRPSRKRRKVFGKSQEVVMEKNTEKMCRQNKKLGCTEKNRR